MQIDFGMVEENAGDNKLHVRRVFKGETIHIPQAIVHFSHNPTCQPAQFLANFGERDPGAPALSYLSLLLVAVNSWCVDCSTAAMQGVCTQQRAKLTQRMLM